jgi:hypothetical protein
VEGYIWMAGCRRGGVVFIYKPPPAPVPIVTCHFFVRRCGVIFESSTKSFNNKRWEINKSVTFSADIVNYRADIIS